MTNAISAVWQDAVARLQPLRTLTVGPGAGDLAASVLSLTSSWQGLVDLAWPVPADGQPARDGHRFTVHCARPQDAASLLPVPDLVIVENLAAAEPGDAPASGPIVAGLLNALRVQARRAAKPYPLVLLFGVTAGGTTAHSAAGAETRPPALAALEDFAATEAPALIYTVMPLMAGIGLLVGRDQAEGEAIRAVFSGLALGRMAQLVAAEAETDRLSLRAENAGLIEKCAAAAIRTEYLYAALRRAQIAASSAAKTPHRGPESGPESGLGRWLGQAPRRATGKLLAAARGRSPDAANQTPGEEAAIERLGRTPILSASWYAAQYPDVAASGVEPAAHYYRHGAAEGRDPGPDFVTAFYLASEPDLAVSGFNPLLHFLDYGAARGLWPSPDFDPAFYLAANPDVAAAGLNPLEHFVAQGRAEGRRGLPPR